MASKKIFRALPVHPDPEIWNYLTTLHCVYKGSPKKEKVESKCASNKRWGPYMVLTSKNFFGALQIDLDLNIRKKGYLNPKIRISRSGCTGRALNFFLLSKTIYGPHLLLLTNFDLALPSRGYTTDPS